MPFPDELGPAIAVVDYNPDWPSEFKHLASRLQAAVGDRAVAIDHIGSTSVPGLAAKNCIDAQIRVTALAPDLVDLMESAGFRCRPEPWNHTETSYGQACEKLVFAPPVGERATNVHVRVATGPNTRYALLFRDYLRADREARDAWGAFRPAAQWFLASVRRRTRRRSTAGSHPARVATGACALPDAHETGYRKSTAAGQQETSAKHR